MSGCCAKWRIKYWRVHGCLRGGVLESTLGVSFLSVCVKPDLLLSSSQARVPTTYLAFSARDWCHWNVFFRWCVVGLSLEFGLRDAHLCVYMVEIKWVICVQWKVQFFVSGACPGLRRLQVLSFFVSTDVGGSSHVSRLSKSLGCLPVRLVEGSSGHLIQNLLLWSEGPQSQVDLLSSFQGTVCDSSGQVFPACVLSAEGVVRHAYYLRGRAFVELRS